MPPWPYPIFADDDRFLFTADQGGNELNHLYVQERNGTIVDLTPGENLKASFGGWAGDYESFYVQTNERDPRFFDVYEYDISSGYPRHMVFQNNDGMFPANISADGRYIALMALSTANDNDLFVEEINSGERIHITPHSGDVSSSPSDFSPDGHYLYYTSDAGGEFRRLLRHDLLSGESEEVLSLDWDIAPMNRNA